MRLMGWIAALAASTAAATAGPAPEYSGFTGNQLHADCSSAAKPGDEIMCMAYITGVAHGLFIAQAARDELHEKTCMPAMPSYRQARLIVEQYMRDHPETLDLNAALVAGSALLDAFPCEKAKKAD